MKEHHEIPSLHTFKYLGSWMGDPWGSPSPGSNMVACTIIDPGFSGSTMQFLQGPWQVVVGISLHNGARRFQMETHRNPKTEVWWRLDTFGRWLLYFQFWDWIHTPRSCIWQASFDCDALCLRGMATGHPQLTQIQTADHCGFFPKKFPRSDVIEKIWHDLGYSTMYGCMCVMFSSVFPVRLMTTAFHIGFARVAARSAWMLQRERRVNSLVLDVVWCGGTGLLVGHF